MSKKIASEDKRRIQTRRSGVHGKGVFAVQDIAEGETIIEYVGQIISDDGREILLKTEQLGNIYIPKSDVKSITKVDLQNDYRAGEFLGQGVFTTRYQFTTNAFPIQKGENYAMVNLYEMITN